jgi:lysophospholipase L1-like esterase
MKLRKLHTLYFVFFSLLMGFGLCEIGLRLAGISFPVIVQIDSIRGTSLRPNAEVLHMEEGNALVKINSEGLHDRERSKLKTENTFRIAVLGDSQVEARQVPIEANFVSILEKNLENCEPLKQKKVEVLNFGVSDYGTAQELLTLRHFVWDYSPDMVILGFLSANDVRNNFRALDGAEYRPYFVYKQDELVLDNSFLESPGYIMRNKGVFKFIYEALYYSRVLQLIKEFRDTLRKNRMIKEYRRNIYKNRSDNLVYHEPVNQKWKEAWRVTEGLLLQFSDEVKAHGAKFLVLGMPWGGLQINPDTKIRQSYMDRFGMKNLFYPEFRVKKLGKKKGFSMLNLAPQFQSYVETNKVYLHGFKGVRGLRGNLGAGHWNEKGHSLAGDIISDHICKSIF